MNSHPKNKFHYGHIEIGYTIAIWLILAAFYCLYRFSDGKPLELWYSWPWWAKAASIIFPIFIFLLGGLFERSRQWPKSNYQDENEE